MTMRLQILSDLHFEFHKDDGLGFLRRVPIAGDVLILPGDIVVFKKGIDALEIIANKFKNKHIIYVKGNHEYYGSEFKDRFRPLDKLIKSAPHFHILENNRIDIEGQEFLGCTLWFRDDSNNIFYKHELSDFHIIKKFTQKVYARNKQSIGFLNENVNENSVIITHHVPSGYVKQVWPFWYANDKNNMARFFICDMTDLILDKQPKLWCFGHTHISCDIVMPCQGTRLVANPLGYAYEANSDYRDDFTVDV